jgi:hypothetical protein
MARYDSIILLKNEILRVSLVYHELPNASSDWEIEISC